MRSTNVVNIRVGKITIQIKKKVKENLEALKLYHREITTMLLGAY